MEIITPGFEVNADTLDENLAYAGDCPSWCEPYDNDSGCWDKD